MNQIEDKTRIKRQEIFWLMMKFYRNITAFAPIPLVTSFITPEG
jgi:hypothetical protein